MSKIKLIREYISLILLEGRVEDVKVKHPDLVKQIDFFVQNEPKGSNSKYLNWELKILNSGQALEGEISDVVNLFDKYSANLKKKDLTQYQANDFTDLRDELFSLRDKRAGKKEKAKERYEIEGGCEADIIYDSDDHRVIHIKNKAASMHYGQGTKWCVTMKDKNYYDDYSANNVVFFFILSKTKDRSDPTYKIAVSVQRDENNKFKEIKYWNAIDHSIGEAAAKGAIGQSSAIIFSKIFAVAKSVPKSLIARISAGEGSPEDCEKFYEYMQVNSEHKPRLLQLLSKNRNVPERLITQMIEDDDSFDRSATLVALQLTRSDDLLISLLDDPDNLTLSTIARRKDLSQRVQEAIVGKLKRQHYSFTNNDSISSRTIDMILKKFGDPYDDQYVQAAIAGNPNVSPTTYMKLAQSENEVIRRGAASNPAAPADVLDKLSEDPACVAAIAANRSASAKTLISIAKRSHKTPVMIALAGNKSIPPEAAKILMSINQDVGDVTNIRQKLAANPNLPGRYLEDLGRDDDIEVLNLVARNPSTPPKTLDALSKSENAQLRTNVMINRSTAVSTLESIDVEDEDESVLYYLVLNPNVTVKILKRLAACEHDRIAAEACVKLDNLNVGS
jgi:hypothetical protein